MGSGRRRPKPIIISIEEDIGKFLFPLEENSEYALSVPEMNGSGGELEAERKKLLHAYLAVTLNVREPWAKSTLETDELEDSKSSGRSYLFETTALQGLEIKSASVGYLECSMPVAPSGCNRYRTVSFLCLRIVGGRGGGGEVERAIGELNTRRS